MDIEQLYFIIGFLLGTIFSGSITVLIWIIWNEWSNNK